MKINGIISLVCLVLFSSAHAQISDSLILNSTSFKNLYKINDSVFRSEQPSKKGFIELELAGIETIISFRRLRNDSTKARGTDLELIHLPLQTKKIKESDIIMALKAIIEAPKPLLIHCWHGSDRTGVVVAAYRMVFENWSKEKAIAEFRQKEYGYHERWYPHLIGILENLDTIAVKQELGLE